MATLLRVWGVGSGGWGPSPHPTPDTPHLSNNELNNQQRDDVRHLDHRVDRRAGRVLVGVTNRVARDGRGVGLGALAAELAVLDQLLRVVPRAAARRHRDGGEE